MQRCGDKLSFPFVGGITVVLVAYLCGVSQGRDACSARRLPGDLIVNNAWGWTLGCSCQVCFVRQMSHGKMRKR